jgi:hypothetical protein
MISRLTFLFVVAFSSFSFASDVPHFVLRHRERRELSPEELARAENEAKKQALEVRVGKVASMIYGLRMDIGRMYQPQEMDTPEVIVMWEAVKKLSDVQKDLEREIEQMRQDHQEPTSGEEL